MKKFSILLLCIACLFSCEKENSENLTTENATLENQKSEPIIELARNFDKELPIEELKKNAEAYSQFNHEEMAIFINERHIMSLEKGATEKKANLAKDLMHSINDYLHEQYNQSYASANEELFIVAYKTVMQDKSSEIYDVTGNEKFWWGSCDSWTRDGKTPVTPSTLSSKQQQSISLKGEFKLNGSGDCDLVYQSSPYSNNLQPRFIYGATSAYRALIYGGSNQNSSKEVVINSSQKSFEFLIGKFRVSQAYGLFDNGQQSFARDTKILLY